MCVATPSPFRGCGSFNDFLQHLTSTATFSATKTATASVLFVSLLVTLVQHLQYDSFLISLCTDTTKVSLFVLNIFFFSFNKADNNNHNNHKDDKNNNNN